LAFRLRSCYSCKSRVLLRRPSCSLSRTIESDEPSTFFYNGKEDNNIKRLKDRKIDLARSLRVRVRECTIDKVPFGRSTLDTLSIVHSCPKARGWSLNIEVRLITHIEKCVRVLTIVPKARSNDWLKHTIKIYDYHCI